MFSHKLMVNNINQDDIKKLRQFLKNPKILTQSSNVKLFEKKWSRWLGVKYSVFVNSGSTSNFISMSIIKNINKNKNKNEIIVPPLTWISDISSIILNNLKPVFVDINLKNLCMNEEKIKKSITKKTLAVFITHAQGFNGLSNSLLNFLKKKKIYLLEDVCESHGATYNKKKLGTFGLISNFSYYYAHHMSTIEGGMVCTNNKKVYEMAKMFRSHGLLRESGNKKFKNKLVKKNKNLSPKFIFLYPTLNFRNNELQAVIGINQIKRLDANNKIRIKNFKYYLSLLDKKKYFTDFDLKGSCNYAFPLIFNKADFSFRKKFENKLKKNNIEFRRGNAGGGNQLRQPYLSKYISKKIIKSKFKNVDHVHFFGYYIGNYPSLKRKKIKKLCNIINSV